MDGQEGDFSQPKSSRQKSTHEYCQGYIDRNGIWNNGFYCPRWGGPDENYCCGDGLERYCCKEVPHELPPVTSITNNNNAMVDNVVDTNTSTSDYIPLVVGISAGLCVLLLALLAGCFTCSRCPAYKRRSHRRPIILTRTISVSMEAEATSSVIAAQALTPLSGGGSNSLNTRHGGGTRDQYRGQSQSSPIQSSDDGHQLHCGCRWSPSTSRSTMVDIESLVATMYQNTALPWQTELDNLYNSYSYDHGPSPSTKEGRAEGMKQVDSLKPTSVTCQHGPLSTFNTNISPIRLRTPSPQNYNREKYNPSLLRSISNNPNSITTSRAVSPHHQIMTSSNVLSSQFITFDRGTRSPLPQGTGSHRTYGYPQQPPSPASSPSPDVATIKRREKTGHIVFEGLSDIDKQKRDSGVLVEEPDSVNDSLITCNFKSQSRDATAINQQLSMTSNNENGMKELSPVLPPVAVSRTAWDRDGVTKTSAQTKLRI